MHKAFALTRRNHYQISPFVIRDLQQTIEPHDYLIHQSNCDCDICAQRAGHKKAKPDSNIFRTSTGESVNWLRKIMDGLCLSGAKTLRIFVPDIVFVGDTLKIYQTNRKDGRMAKLTGTVPLKSLYPTMVRLRRQYKTVLEQNFTQKMLKTIDRSFMHVKYFDKFVPSHFSPGTDNPALQQNRFHFKNYILHKNKKYQIQQLQQHKMNEKQPFCLVKYKDGNCQLFNQLQFQIYCLGHAGGNKLAQEIMFIQSYIKYKLQTQAIYFSQYNNIQKPKKDSSKDDNQHNDIKNSQLNNTHTQGQSLNQTTTNMTSQQFLQARAQREVTLLIGGIDKYDQAFSDIQQIQQSDMQLMVTKPKQYVQLMTHKIVHYLAMTSSIYIQHIKIKWIVNDLGTVYLQQIIQLQLSDIPNRYIRFRLPPKDQPVEYFHAAHQFGDMYKEMRKRKAANTALIRKQIQGKSYEEMLAMMDSQADLENISLHALEKSNTGHKSLGVRINRKKHQSQAKGMQLSSKGNDDYKKGENPEQKQTKMHISMQVGKQKLNKSNRYQQSQKNTNKINIRMQSIGLDRWKNLGQSVDKERTSRKIANYFTLNAMLKQQETSKYSPRKQGRLRRQIVKNNKNATLEAHSVSLRNIDKIQSNQSGQTGQNKSLSHRIRKRISFALQ